MKLVVRPSEQMAARLRLKIADDLGEDLPAEQRAFLMAIAEAPRAARADHAADEASADGADSR